jgi:transposase
MSARVHRRYRVVEEVRKGHAIPEAADRVGCHFTVAYDWVHRFNGSGFASFERVANPKGRPAILKAEQLRELVEVAGAEKSGRRRPLVALSAYSLIALQQ